MKLDTALQGIDRLYIDSAPLIYYVEQHVDFFAPMVQIVHHIESTSVQVFTSVIALTEVMVQPLRTDNTELAQEYHDILVARNELALVPVTTELAISAGAIRARYALRTPDAIHVATALATDCDAILTNDADIRRVTELNVLILKDLEL